MSKNPIPIEELISEMHRLNDIIEYEGSPRVKDMAESGDYSPTTYKNRFGSWNEALEECGFNTNNNTNVTKEEVISEIQRVSQEFFDGSSPRIVDMRELGEYSWTIYEKLDESYNELLQEAGLETNYRHSKEELIEDLKKIGEELERRPKCYELKELSKYSRGTFRRAFGSWEKAVVQAGFEPFEYPTGEEHPHWKEGYTDKFGKLWRSRRRDVLKRDRHSCCVCQGQEEADFLDVHHINPRRKYNVETEYEEMNSKDNLVSLCRSCHRTFEGKWKNSCVDEFIEKAKSEYND